MLRTFFVVSIAAAALLACGPKPRPMTDAGEELDAGMELDAGRQRGDDPPNGWQVAVELPMGAAAPASAHLGPHVASAGDQFGQPLIAALYEDPNGDGTFDDNRVVFTRWDGAARAFTMLKTIEVVGGGSSDVDRPSRNISIARDAATGRIAIAYIKAQDNTVRLAVSDDEGANFSLSTVSDVPRAALMSNPSLAMAGGNAHLAWLQGSDLMYRKRLAGAATWTDVPAGPIVAGGRSISLALDADGNAGIAFFVSTGLGTADLAYWRTSASAMVAVSGNMIDLSVSRDREPSVSLTFVGNVPHVAYHLRAVAPLAMNDNTAELFYAKADAPEASTWSVIPIPRNGNATTFHTTRWYQALTIDATGRVNVAANFGASGAQSNCGGPKLSRATDGMSFQTCAPAGFPTQFAGEWISMWPHRAGKQTIVFAYDTPTGSRSNPNLKPGIAMWREP